MENKEIKVTVGKGTDSMAIAMMQKGFEDNGYYFKKWENETTAVFTNDTEYKVQ